MSDNRRQRIEDIFHQAVELAPEARPAFLDEVCADDESLRQEVETLLANSGTAAAETVTMFDNLSGRTIGPYQVLGRIGAGGMGVVYQARDTQLDRTVAIKVLPADRLGDADRKRRFIQEAKAASALNHPNIVTIHTITHEGGADCIVMEYVAGKTLADAIPRKGLPVKEALRIAIEIADAMAAAHAAGIVHRDLKPSNVMLTESGRVKVLDFGLAKLVEGGDPTGTEPGKVVGTAAYMSPEQAQGHKVDARTDIFAFGCVLYEMVTGRRAFPGETTLATLAAIIHEESAPLEGVSPEVVNLIGRCLRKDPARRYQHMDDVKLALEELAEEEQRGLAGKAPARKAPRRWLVGGASGLCLALAVTAGIIFWPAGQAQPRLTTGDRASPNREANEYFEKAVLLLLSRSDLPRSREMLEKALAIDPRFAAARALYGFSHWRLIDWGYSNDTSWLYKAEDELRRALQDDPQVQAHGPLAAVYFSQGRKELVLAEIDKALKIDPTEKYALHWLAHYHRLHGDYGDALGLWRKIVDREPLFWPSRMNIGDTLRMMGDSTGAIREQEKILDQSPENVFARHYLAMAYLSAGHIATARQTLDRVRPEDRARYLIRMPWALTLALEGRREEAVKEMDEELLKWGAADILMTLNVAEFYAVLGDTPKALEWLERCVRSGDERAEWFHRDPLLASIRDQPRFRQILESVEYRRRQRSRQ